MEQQNSFLSLYQAKKYIDQFSENPESDYQKFYKTTYFYRENGVTYCSKKAFDKFLGYKSKVEDFI